MFAAYQQVQPKAVDVTFLRTLAFCLQTQANMLNALHLPERALIVIRKVEEIYRKLLNDQPEPLARCLSNLGGILIKLGKHEEALLAIQESAKLYRTSSNNQSAAVASDLPGTLIIQSGVLDALGRYEEAQSAWHEAGVGGCKKFCVNGFLAGNCRLAWSNDDRRDEYLTHRTHRRAAGELQEA